MSSSKIQVAEHLLNQTYPALKDPKILLSVLQNVHDAIDEGITAALTKARDNKEVPAFGSSFTQKVEHLRKHLAGKLKVTPIDFMFISELREILKRHEDSSVEFRRKKSFVIADDDFHLSSITPEKTKTYIARAKSLLSRL